MKFFRQFSHFITRHQTKTIMQDVMAAFEQYDPMKLNFAFLTLCTIYNQIRLIGGCNNYWIEHMGKQRLNHAGLLLDKINVVDVVDFDDELGVDDAEIERMERVDEEHDLEFE
jgi:hypothetical protein